MASATSSPRPPERRQPDSRIGGIRDLEEPLRRLAGRRRDASLLYLELTGLEGLPPADVPEASAACKRAVSLGLRRSIGSGLRRRDLVAAGPGGHWFVALLADRAKAKTAAGVPADARLGIAAGRLCASVRAALTVAARDHRLPAGAGVRCGWTVLERIDRKRPLESLRHAIRGAAVVARVEAERATMLAAINHELRTPLTSIGGYAERLRDGGRLSEAKRRRYLAIVEEEARRLRALVEGLVDLGSWTTGNLHLDGELLDVREVARSAWAVVAPRAAERAIRLRVRGAARAFADRRRLAQVMINLLDNAVRHARRGVTVALSIGAGHLCRIAVADDGPGFDPRIRQALGTPFIRGKGGRIGLGLAISRLIVEAHGGTMRAAGTRCGGAKVTLTLPAHVPLVKTRTRVTERGGSRRRSSSSGR